MKITYIFWLMIFGSIQLMAQSFVSENKLWSIIGQDSNEGNWAQSSFFKFSEDTTINQMQYKKLYVSDNEHQTDWKFNSSWNERNDSVFQYLDSKGIDILIYDFNLEEKDSFYFYWQEDYLYVDSVKIKQWGNKDRKHIYLKSKWQPNLQTIWIQGVGQNGLITRSSETGVLGAIVKILCYSENGEKVYQNPKYDGCYIHTSIEKVEQAPQLLSCKANNNGVLTIELIRSQGGVFSLFTPESKLERKMSLSRATTRICSLSSGLYIFRFESNEGIVQTGKVLVK